MAAFCIDTNSPLFKETAKKLGVSEFELEQIAYKYGNQEGTFGQFPSDEYIKANLDGVPNYNASEAQAELWKLRYSTPREFDTIEELNEAKQDALRYFNEDSVRYFLNSDGKYELRVGEQDNEYQRIREQAIKDGTFMKAPNGKDTNLTEQQWLQVRSKAFKDWFGDWENDPTNASKVVDENGEPRVVYAGYRHNDFSVFDTHIPVEVGQTRGRGSYFSPRRQAATSYANFDESRVKSVFLNIRNPYNSLTSNADWTSIETITDELIAQGYDGFFDVHRRYLKEVDGKGFIVLGVNDRGVANVVEEIVAYEPNQIKSATENRGTFYENDPGIYNQESSDTGNVTGLPDQMTANEAFQILSKQYAPDSSEAKLSKLVFDALQKTGITFRAADLPPYWRGRFIASENVIEFNKRGILDNTLLHESIHAVTTYYMHAANTEGFSDDVKIAIKEIEECYSLLKEDFLDQKTKNGGDRNAIFSFYTEGEYYGLKSSTELVAEITRPEILSLIRDYDARHKGQNIFQRLIDAIAKFFGINKTYGSLEKTLKDALVTLITHPDKSLMDRYALETKTAKENIRKLIDTPNTIAWNRKKAIDNLASEEFDTELDTELEVAIPEVKDIIDVSPEAHNVFTQSPIGTIFRVPSENGYGWFLLNGSPIIEGNTAKVPIKLINLNWFQTHTFDVATSQNGVAYMTNIKPLFGTTAQQSSFISQAEFYSGNAYGSDKAWASEARKLGIRVRDFEPSDYAKLSNEEKAKIEQEYVEARNFLGKPVLPANGSGGMFTRRDMMQADNADAIFAIGKITPVGGTEYSNGRPYINRSGHENVAGGTANAVARGIIRGIPVYVYDRDAKQWKTWDATTKSFIATEEPVLTPHAAVIGTRGEYYADRQEYDITDEEKGVIRSVLQKTIGQPQQQSQQTLDIWAGQNPTNADLSNFAYRPFTIPMGFQLPNGTYVSIPWQARSVEAAFQALKLNYTNKGTLEEEAENSEIQKAILSGRWQNEREDGAAVKRLGNKIKNLNQPEWIRDRQAIMKELIKMSFQQNPQALQRLLATGDAILTHNRESSESIWRTEFPRILMEVRSELRAEQSVTTTPETPSQEEPLYAPPKVERDFHEREVTVVTKMDNLMKSGYLTVTEITDEANKVMDWISDQLTQYQENPELVWSKYKKSENREEVIAKAKDLSRRELAEYIGLDNIINIYANEVISLVPSTPEAEGNEKMWNALGRKGRQKYGFIKENITGLIQYGYTRFLSREGFGFQLSDVKGQTFTTTEVSTEDRENVDNFNSVDNIDGNTAELGNQQEHWMIESATRDIMDNASQKVKQAIADCFILEDNGKTNPDGSIKYDIATDKLNRNERVVPIQAVRSIVRWTQGAISLSQMVEKLSAKVDTNPWVSQIVTRLQDTSGNESDFQSQFFNTFCKHFQTYTIVKMNPDGSYYTMEVNVNPALKDAMDNIVIQQKVGGWALVNENGVLNTSNLEQFGALIDTLESLGNLDDTNRTDAADIIGQILYTVGLPQDSATIQRILTDSLKNDVWTNAKNVWQKLEDARKANVREVHPFEYGGDYAVRGFVRNLIKPFTDVLEDTMVSSVFDSGKMYQSYITPSWTTKLFQKMKLPKRDFQKFVIDEFFSSEWFIDDKNMFDGFDQEAANKLSEEERNQMILDHKIKFITENPESIRNPWLRTLWDMDDKARQEVFEHKVQLNFNKENYMRGMNDLTYVMSVFTEFYADSSTGEKGNLYSNFRFPMLSNKPSNEFVRFIRHTDIGDGQRLGRGAQAIQDGYYKIFLQELSRIQTVEMRNLKKGDEGYIANFDIGEEGNQSAGNSFKFLDYLNDYLYGEKKDTTLGKLINRVLHGTEPTILPEGSPRFKNSFDYVGSESNKFVLNSDEYTLLEKLVKEEVAKHLNGLADRLIQQYTENGLFEALKKIEGVGKTDFDVKQAIREFAWNDNYAQANLLQLLITDKAFYKNEEDIQKRLAQVHSPGIRGNWEATDFNGKSVSDGKLRVVKLKDYNEVKESIIENLEAIAAVKIEEAAEDQKQATKDLWNSIIDAYKKINVVDGQALVSPTAYRKKAIAFGEWTKEDEEVYNDLLAGKFNMAKVKKVFNPRKPFTYGKTTKRSNPALNTPIKNLRYGVQYKDSEYLLIMADALLRGQETGRPNLLGAIFDVMEESYKADPRQGIDFVVFDSGVKTGLQGAISINEFVTDPNGRALARQKIMDSIYVDGKLGSAYNENFVDVLDAEDYTTQQTVPEHFMHGSLQWGSQIRALMPSDLETSYDGQDVVYDCEYEVEEKGEDGKIHTVIKKNPTAEQLRKAWEENTKKMIDLSVEELKKELGLVDGMSIADSNVLISKILQREILSNPRYGVDLLLACSVDAEGNFRIPLGDPIQSKRIEQLLNSIVKNRINKQKVAGGTLVEVTNFGTSKRLNIRFKDKKGGLLDTREQYLAKGHTEAEFKEYVKKNQNGIAYYECYAPAWSRDLFLKFADEKGNIDIEAIEMLDPDLLKMFGYRIPTEDKYSTAPYKIVGFLPQEAGDGFMQPWETTVIDGSDFDVDKKNLMRMALELKSKLMSKKEFFKQNGLTEETEENNRKFNDYRRKAVSASEIMKKLPDNIDIVTSAEPAIVKEALGKAEKSFERRVAKSNLDKAKEKAEELKNKKTSALLEKEGMHSDELQAITNEYNRIIENAEAAYRTRISDIEQMEHQALEKEIISAMLRKRYIWQDSSKIPANERALFLAIKKAYIDTAFKVERPTSGKDYYNNLMFNMQWAIATHASTADKMLNPGNFDVQKRMGYMTEAYRLGYSWEELQGKSIDELKKLVMTSKNLMDFDVQTQFYKQNAVAGQILGIFAVAKSAHAMFEGRNYGITIEKPFYIDGKRFGGVMHYDQKYDRTGITLIGKTLGSLVGASADAVKDPVLNYMNINKETVNVLNTALRLGMDFDTIALLLSTSVVNTVLGNYRKNSLSRKTSFDKEVRNAIRELEKRDYIGKDSPLQNQEVTKEEMVWALRKVQADASKEDIQRYNKVAYKILNAIQGLSEASKTAQPLTDLSRLNSITSAPGPLHINTLTSDRKFGPSMSMDGIVKITQRYKDATGKPVVFGDYVNGTEVTENNIDELTYSGAVTGYEEFQAATRQMVFDELPSLEAFYEGYNIVKDLFARLKFTTASSQFRQVLNAIPEAMQFSIYSKDKLLSSLADFFQSYLLVQSGVIKSSDLKRYTTEFVTDYIEGKYTKDEKVKENPLIKAIQPKLISKKGEPDRYALSIDTTGMEQSEKDVLSAGWAQLEKDDPELSHKLFVYNFFRGGIGFSPKTFMALMPIQVKEQIGGYLETYTDLPTIDAKTVFDQWVRNNWTNTDLVPRVTNIPLKENQTTVILDEKQAYLADRAPYLRISTDSGEFLFRQRSESQANVYDMVEPLGNNREYLEMYPTDVKAEPIDPLQRGVATLETPDTEFVEQHTDDPNVEATPKEQTRELTAFYQEAFTEGNEAAEQRENLDKQFDEANKDLGIKTNQDKFEDIMQDFC